MKTRIIYFAVLSILMLTGCKKKVVEPNDPDDPTVVLEPIENTTASSPARFRAMIDGELFDYSKEQSGVYDGGGYNEYSVFSSNYRNWYSQLYNLDYTIIEIEKGTVPNPNNLSDFELNDQFNDLFPLGSYAYDANLGNGIAVRYFGYSTEYGPQTNSSFTVLEREISNNQHEVSIKAIFNCTLYDLSGALVHEITDATVICTFRNY